MRLSDTGIAALERLPALERLDLSHCQGLTHTSAYHVGTVTSLRELYFERGEWVEDGGVAMLAGLTRLTTLTLDHNVSDAELHYVSNMSSLERLMITDARNITDVGYATLTCALQ